jgi:hypothetical protein
MDTDQTKGRSERRRLRKDDQKRIARGVDVRRNDADDLGALMRVLHGLLQTSIERRSVDPLMEFMWSNLTRGAGHLAGVRTACASGCSHCCNLWVEASAPEVLFTVKRMDAARRAIALEAVEAACAQTAGVGFEERVAMLSPCPMLKGNLCTVYAERPLVCRTAVSTDAETCRRSLIQFSGEDIPVPLPWTSLRHNYRVALEGALYRAGLPHQAREWNESLRIALGDSDAEARWLAGADVFAGLPMPRDTVTHTHPHWRAIYAHAFGSLP